MIKIVEMISRMHSEVLRRRHLPSRTLCVDATIAAKALRMKNNGFVHYDCAWRLYEEIALAVTIAAKALYEEQRFSCTTTVHGGFYEEITLAATIATKSLYEGQWFLALGLRMDAL